MADLRNLRSRFVADEAAEAAGEATMLEATKRAKAGTCPACGHKQFKGLVCRSCRFDASDMISSGSEPSTAEDVDRDVRVMAARAIDFRENPPAPVDPVKEKESEALAELVAADERERRRERSTVIPKRTEDGARYAVEEDPVTGKLDAVIQFGKWRGHAISALATTPDGSDYLRWVLAEKFPEDLKAICRFHLGIPEVA